jgi:hypothetical protein
MLLATTSVVEISVPLMLVLGGMSSVVLATLWLTTRLASIERSLADLRLAVTKDFATKSGLDRLEHRVTLAEQRLSTLTEWRAGVDRRLEVVETGRIAAAGE